VTLLQHFFSTSVETSLEAQDYCYSSYLSYADCPARSSTGTSFSLFPVNFSPFNYALAPPLAPKSLHVRFLLTFLTLEHVLFKSILPLWLLTYIPKGSGMYWSFPPPQFKKRLLQVYLAPGLPSTRDMWRSQLSFFTGSISPCPLIWTSVGQPPATFCDPPFPVLIFPRDTFLS